MLPFLDDNDLSPSNRNNGELSVDRITTSYFYEGSHRTATTSCEQRDRSFDHTTTCCSRSSTPSRLEGGDPRSRNSLTLWSAYRRPARTVCTPPICQPLTEIQVGLCSPSANAVSDRIGESFVRLEFSSTNIGEAGSVPVGVLAVGAVPSTLMKNLRRHPVAVATERNFHLPKS